MADMPKLLDRCDEHDAGISRRTQDRTDGDVTAEFREYACGCSAHAILDETLYRWELLEHVVLVGRKF